MSRDIRSFFQSKKPLQQKLDHDDDVIPESPEVTIKSKKKESRKKRILCDDSDDDNLFAKKNKKNIDSNKKPSAAVSKTSLKEVKALDIFGTSKVKRTEPLVKKEKKKTETGIHSDEEFDRSLLELDEPKANKSVIVENNTDNSVQTETDVTQLVIPSNPETTKTLKQDKKKGDHDNSETQSQKTNEGKAEKRNSKSKLEQKKEILKHHNGSEEKNARKRDYSEFLENNESLNIDEDQPKRKRKHDKSLNDSVLTDEERHERKIHSAALYQKYLNRTGPKHLGSKELPQGSPNCLANCAFLLTGVLDSFERDEIADAITKFGGTVKNSISKKVTHVLAGEDAGPAKMAKAEELGIKILNEDDFLQLIRDSSNNTSDKKNKIKESPNQKESKSIKKEKISPQEKNKTNRLTEETKIKHDKSENKTQKVTEQTESKTLESAAELKTDVKVTKSKSSQSSDITKVKKETKLTASNLEDSKKQPDKDIKPVARENSVTPSTPAALMWVDKYKPQNVKQIIGQHGDASNVKKLTNWLTKWFLNRKAKVPKPSPWAKNDDGAYYKAALLSGPPGVGKTTTVGLVCRELGFDVVELNASDTRNKSLMRDQIGELLTTTSLQSYAMGNTGKQAVSKKHVLVMDEVDGMAGNEDRGGLQELIGLIKSTSVPIICMCNDRNSQKMRSLVNYCYDLRFSRPRVDQIKSAMLSICFKEGIKIPADSLTQLIVSAGQDVRQTLNLLSMWAVEPSLADAESLKKDALTVRKDVKLGPWEAVRKVFFSEEHKSMSINDKSDLFFYDYSLAPLFVQENYLQVSPHCPKNELLQRFSNAADSISIGDMVEAKIRRSQAWNLLPIQAMYSSVIPGTELSGHVAGQIQFPAWLGKNSRANKMHRLCQEIHAHTRLSTSGSKSSIYLDYSSHLRDAILTPLIRDHSGGIDRALETLQAYHLLREDLDSLVELALWPGQRDPMLLVDSKVKAAMTRTYNKMASSLPYAPGTVKKSKRDDNQYEDNEIDNEQEEETQDSDPENDALIKKKKTKESEKSSSKEKPSSSKGKPGSSKETKKKK